MKPKKTINKKISVLCAFRIMQEVYAPLVKRFKELHKNGDDDNCALIIKFCLVGHDKALDNDITYFENLDMSYSPSIVGKNILKLHSKYSVEFGNNFILAIASVLKSAYRDIMRYTEDMK